MFVDLTSKNMEKLKESSSSTSGRLTWCCSPKFGWK
jgi:hypothetical protein